ncbi:DUF6975 family protein [Sphingomonas morindae]|uniref:Uncharacterized protein n=1 Tax=Sphingomonas morindae TaxID=1541170 RepID=A0ABY4X807_9SPHN|nr:hypothetical protein [Sphingomonas morindae]USI73044.1 hypothetical protein LHA26_00765 [Sphingomonas morindae]
MASKPGDLRAPDMGSGLAAVIARDGSAAHPHVLRLATAAAPDLADCVHFLALLHGRFPGVLDHAAERVFATGARDWMFRAAAAFAAERAFLARLVLVVGAMPITIAQTQSENAALQQAHALGVLAQSERRGTALGAALALVLDWPAIRLLMERAGAGAGLALPPLDLPSAEDSYALLPALFENAGVERAVRFGVQQLLLQHQGLWDLLETRAGTRR